MGRLAPAVSPDFRDSPLGAHPPHIDVDGRKGLPALPSSVHSVLGVWGGRPGLVTSPQAPSPPSLCPVLALALPVSLPQRLMEVLTSDSRCAVVRPTGLCPLWPCLLSAVSARGCRMFLSVRPGPMARAGGACRWGSHSLWRGSVTLHPSPGSPTHGLMCSRLPTSHLWPGQDCRPRVTVSAATLSWPRPWASGAPGSRGALHSPSQRSHCLCFCWSLVQPAWHSVASRVAWICDLCPSRELTTELRRGPGAWQWGRGGVTPPPAGFGVLRTSLQGGGRAHGLQAMEASLGSHAPGSQVCPWGGALMHPGVWWAGLTARSSSSGCEKASRGIFASLALLYRLSGSSGQDRGQV